MRSIIPGFWNVCVNAQSVEASAPNEAIQMAADLVSKAAAKSGLYVTAEVEK
jgi:hypothetical protein